MRRLAIALGSLFFVACTSNVVGTGSSGSPGTQGGDTTSGGATDTSPGGGVKSPSGGGTGTPGAGVTIENAAFTPGSTDATITFVLHNLDAQAIDRVQSITLTSGGWTETFTSSCGYTWRPGPGETSGILSLQLYVNGTYCQLTPDACTSSSCTATESDLGAAVTIDLKGLFSDGTVWKAHAVASS